MSHVALRLGYSLALAAAVWISSCEAHAHPHVLPTVRANLLFNSSGKLAAIEYAWLYDLAYSTFVSRDIDLDHDGKISDDELNAFAKNQVDALGAHNYFTTVVSETGSTELNTARTFSARKSDDGQLEIDFTVPLKTPTLPDRQFRLELFDPEMFAYFTMAKDGVRLVDAPPACEPQVTGPAPIDLRNTRSIPAVFWDALNNGSKVAALQLVNRINVICPSSVTAGR
jgi:ABC-type uncharacterized transport system substrate-binding protein